MHDESVYARSVANYLGVKLVEIPISDIGFEKFESIVEKLDEPFIDSSILPTYIVAEAVGKEHKIALTGDGADELFAGYKHYQRALVILRNKKLLNLFKPMLTILTHLLKRRANNKVKRWLENASQISHNKAFYNMQLMMQPCLTVYSPMNVIYRTKEIS